MSKSMLDSEEGMSEIEKAILAKMYADCFIREPRDSSIRESQSFKNSYFLKSDTA